MKVIVELSEWEIKQAVAKAIKEKTGLELYTDKIRFTGSFRFKRRSVRKEIKRIIAAVVIDK